ncbi:MAG: type II secretion system protein [Candidatus Adlerbacteria bacterium]|nr:type II secretion system protein [Candidatus Adlerbacteria bacterium]
MHTRGFTLIELMVSVTIFIIVMVISLGSLLSISSAERKAESLKTVMNNLHFALDSMSRSIRTGIDYHCTSSAPLDQSQDCPSGDDYFAFRSVDSAQGTVVYCQGNGSSCSSSGTAILRSVNGGNFSPITAPEVDITSLTFYVVGSVSEFDNDPISFQPKVVITLTGEVPLGTQLTSFNLQTSVTQRLYDQ